MFNACCSPPLTELKGVPRRLMAALLIFSFIGAFDCRTVEAAPGTATARSRVTTLSLLNSSTGQSLRNIGATYRLNASSSLVSLEAKVRGRSAGVLFYVNGKLVHEDVSAPYTLTKPQGAGVSPWVPAPGRYKVDARPFHLSNGKRVMGTSRQSTITVVGAWATPTPQPTSTPQPNPTSQPTPTPLPSATSTSSAVSTHLSAIPEVAIPSGGERWSASLPTSGDVTIPAGRTVILDSPLLDLNHLVVMGTLVCGPNDSALTARSIMVHGKFICGSRSQPHTKKLTITLKGSPSDQSVMGMGTAVLGVMDGTLSLHGSAGKVSWTKLAKSALKGSTSFELLESSGWQAGDEIAVASSDLNQKHAERLTVTAVNGSVVTFTPPLQFDHLALVKQYGEHTVDMRAEVGLLTRNIVIKGTSDALSKKFGGHTMVMGGSTMQVRGVELTLLGQLNILGRYPIHLHLMENNCKNCYVADTSVHDTVQRGIVLHGTHGVLVQNNVVYNTVGHNIIAEDSNTWGNLYDRNLAFVNTSVLLTEPTLSKQNDKNAANFWFKASGNVVSNNVAAGSETNGFSYDDTHWATDRDSIVMKDNTAHSIEASMRADPQNDFPRVGGLMLLACHRNMPPKPQIEGVTVYQSELGIWSEECSTGTDDSGVVKDPDDLVGGFFHIRNARLADNYGSHLFPLAFTDTKLTDSLFVRGGTGAAKADALHVQYGSDVTTVNTTFADYGTSVIMSGHDTDDPWSATFSYASPKFINTAKDSLLRGEAPEGTIVNLLDDTVYPRGSYIMDGDHPAHESADPAVCTRKRGVEFVPGEFGPDYYSCPLFTPQLAKFRVVLGENGAGSSIFQSASLRRSDGLTFYTREYLDQSMRVLVNSNLSYEVLAEPSSRVFSMEALSDAMYPLAQTDFVMVSVPLAKAPVKVRRGIRGPDELTVIAELSPVGGIAELRSNKASSYFYDGKRLHVAVSENVIEVQR